MLRPKFAKRPQIRAAIGSLVLVVVALSVPSASAAAPAGPVVVAPANGATNVSRSPSLDVTVTDPDGGTMDVTFFGRPATGQLPGDFTLGVMPDTQYYSKNENNNFAKYMAQVQWYRDTRSQLNTVFITHLGDVVEHWNDESEFQRASQAQAVLDNASIPNSITTGNHDVYKPNGDAPLFDQYFPPSRYESNSWYGGYLGDTTDAVAETTNRLNKDSYHLINVGSLKFLFISLEVDLPPYALQWAQNVINAYPDRRVVVTTHGFIRPQGQRHDKEVSKGRTAAFTTAINAFNQFIYPNCNIFLVLSGHFHGEARRVNDTNACGKPVYQILSNYQHLTNGGDGWLRYMTFHPSQNRIDAFTYSPTLGRFDTDNASQFNVSYNMASAPPGPFQSLGVAEDVPSGGHAVLAWPGLAANTQYEWYAVASDGGASTQGPTSAFTTGTGGGGPNSPPVATNQNVVVQRNVAKSIHLMATDPDGDPITYSIVSNPSHGTLSGSGASRTYTPANGYQGTDSFTFRGSDATSSGNVATVNITVAAGTSEISITNTGFSKATVSVPPGTFVNWTNTGSAQHRVVDDSGLGLYDSGLLSNGQSWGRVFSGPGLWLYRDPTTGATANVRIKPNVSPANGGTSTTFTITWATAAPPAGMVYDVQIKRGAAAWDNWSTDVSSLSRTFVADAGTGSYQFRSRTQRTSDGAETGWSGGVTIQVG